MTSPVDIYLAEELAAAYLVNDAQKVVLQDTIDRLRLCMNEVGRLNTHLNNYEETIESLRNNLTTEMSVAVRLELENRTLKAMVSTMKKNLDRYRKYCRNKADRPRNIPATFPPYLTRNQDRRDDAIARIREENNIVDLPDIQEEPDTEMELDVDGYN